jgi:hypothetical protein
VIRWADSQGFVCKAWKRCPFDKSGHDDGISQVTFERVLLTQAKPDIRKPGAFSGRSLGRDGRLIVFPGNSSSRPLRSVGRVPLLSLRQGGSDACGSALYYSCGK